MSTSTERDVASLGSHQLGPCGDGGDDNDISRQVSMPDPLQNGHERAAGRPRTGGTPFPSLRCGGPMSPSSLDRSSFRRALKKSLHQS
jgi:hypothetical protein